LVREVRAYRHPSGSEEIKTEEGIRSAQRTDAIRRGKREPETKILSKGKKMLEEGRRL